MPRVTLYVPDDLKTRMDAVGEALNWSAVAQRAFREAISTHHVEKDHSDMENVIERLRASKERFEAAELEAGKRAGSQWAKAKAEYHELAAVADFDVDDYEGDLDSDAFERLIDPEGEVYPRDWQDFWKRHYSHGTPSDSFIRGFIEGATEVYNEIAAQL